MPDTDQSLPNNIQQPSVPTHIHESLLKAQRAIEIAGELFEICKDHATSEDPELLNRAGPLLGDFVNNLRSALNYTTRAIILREVLPKLSFSKQKKLKRNMDFPSATSQENFESKQIIKILKEVDVPLYKRIRSFQPYHPGNDWLGHLITLSNRDKHVVLNRVRSPTASAFLAFLPDGTQLKEPWFVGDKLVIFTKEGPQAAELPFYYGPLKAFATPRKTWSLYLVPVFEKFSLDLVEFTRTTPLSVVHILAALEALYYDFGISESS